MISFVRDQYNDHFTPARYQQFLDDIHSSFGYTVPFRIAESPVFVDRELKGKLLQAADSIIDFIVQPDFRKISDRAIPQAWNVPGQDRQSLFLALDFAIVRQDGQLTPQLIELQGFPSLFGWQHLLARKYREHFFVPEHFTNHFNLSDDAYVSMLKRVLLNGHDPKEVVLMEIEPYQQNTAIDFIVTEHLTGVRPVHIGDVEKEGNRLYYRRQGIRTPIRRIYNRVIVDELARRGDLKLNFGWTDQLDVEWAGHPNWFFGISKFLMPYLKSPFVPECRLLSEYDTWPSDLEQYVLKPLFSFSGTGVIFHVRREDLDAIPVEKRNEYLLQRKVQYEPVLRAPDGHVKVEIRLLFVWENGAVRPVPVTNLARLSRGEMIGVKYNKDKTWVGGSICFLE